MLSMHHSKKTDFKNTFPSHLFKRRSVWWHWCFWRQLQYVTKTSSRVYIYNGSFLLRLGIIDKDSMNFKYQRSDSHSLEHQIIFMSIRGLNYSFPWYAVSKVTIGYLQGLIPRIRKHVRLSRTMGNFTARWVHHEDDVRQTLDIRVN